MRVVAVNASPSGAGRTAVAIDAVLAGARELGAAGRRLDLGGPAACALPDAARALHEGDAIVLGSPIYRASDVALLRALLEATPRAGHGETAEPLRGRAVVLVATAGSLHHLLALGQLRELLSGFFAAHVLSVNVYVPSDGFDEAGALTPPYAELAHDHGAALVEQARALATSRFLKQIRPQA